MFTRQGEKANIYDYTTISKVVERSQIAHANDLITVDYTVVSAESTMVKGWSHVSGKYVIYMIPTTQEVGLWTV